MSLKTPGTNQGGTLSECVATAMKHYFAQLDGHGTSDLYDLVMREVERPLLQVVLQETGGNQSRAATLLGMSRSTLRKKLAQYGIE